LLGPAASLPSIGRGGQVERKILHYHQE